MVLPKFIVEKVIRIPVPMNYIQDKIIWNFTFNEKIFQLKQLFRLIMTTFRLTLWQDC